MARISNIAMNRREAALIEPMQITPGDSSEAFRTIFMRCEIEWITRDLVRNTWKATWKSTWKSI